MAGRGPPSFVFPRYAGQSWLVQTLIGYQIAGVCHWYAPSKPSKIPVAVGHTALYPLREIKSADESFVFYWVWLDFCSVSSVRVRSLPTAWKIDNQLRFLDLLVSFWIALGVWFKQKYSCK